MRESSWISWLAFSVHSVIITGRDLRPRFLGRPLVYPMDEQLTVSAGQRIEMSVEFCANPSPTKTFWVTATKRIAPGHSVDEFIAQNITAGSSLHCRVATLTLTRVLPIHEGEYMFLVRSPNGLAEGTFVLNVTRASGFQYSNAPAMHWSVVSILFIPYISVYL